MANKKPVFFDFALPSRIISCSNILKILVKYGDSRLVFIKIM